MKNHRKDTKTPNAIHSCRHFQQQGHNFNSHAKFIVLDKIVNTSSSKDILREHLIQRENLWIHKLKTLVPYGLNQELCKQKMKTVAPLFHVHFYLDHSSKVTLKLRWCHNIRNYIWHHVKINKFRISTNSLGNGHCWNYSGKSFVFTIFEPFTHVQTLSILLSSYNYMRIFRDENTT